MQLWLVIMALGSVIYSTGPMDKVDCYGRVAVIRQLLEARALELGEDTPMLFFGGKPVRWQDIKVDCFRSVRGKGA